MNKEIKGLSFVLIITFLFIVSNNYAKELDSNSTIWTSVAKYDVDTINDYYFNANPLILLVHQHFYIFIFLQKREL